MKKDAVTKDTDTTIKVVVVALGANKWLVCPKAKFNLGNDGLLRMVFGWELNNVHFDQNSGYRMHEGSLVWVCRGTRGEPAHRVFNIVVRDYVLYYEDVIPEA